LRRDGGPTVAAPVRVKREMDAEVGVGVSFGPLCDFGEPRTGNENAGGSDPVLFEGFDGGGVDGVHHAEIVGMNDEEAGVGGVAEALGKGFGFGRLGLLREGTGKRTKKKEDNREKTLKRFHGRPPEIGSELAI